MRSAATTPAAYLASLDPEPRKEIQAVRKVIRANLPKGYVETVDFGMLAYVVPLAVYPDTYNGRPLQLAALAAQKNHNSVYLMSVYGDAKDRAWFEAAYEKTGKRLDMGKSCVRFRRASDLPLDLIGQAVARVSVDEFVARANAARSGRRR